MDDEEALYRKIAAQMEGSRDSVTQGKMMSRPGIKYKGKVFAFYRKEQMVFKLGHDYDPGDDGVEDWSYLDPFKNKPPMKGWYQIPFSRGDVWPDLAEKALAAVAAEVDG